MTPERRFHAGNVVLFTAALAHALLTWPLADTLALFFGGTAIAFVLEAIGIRLGLLEHHTTPQVAGVPVTVLFAWPAVVYFSYRFALVVVADPVAAAALAAVLATFFDLLTDHQGVRDGFWSYPESRVSDPRYRGVPWWNFLAWLCIVFVTALLPTLVDSVG